MEIQFGIAVSNCADSLNPDYQLPNSLQRLINTLTKNGMGAEVQLEYPLQQPPGKIERGLIPFLGVHLPIGDVDFFNESLYSQSIERTQRSIELARNMKADYIVTHLQMKHEWERIPEREKLNNYCRTVLSTVFDLAEEVGFSGSIYGENLEFPLFPATADETRDLQNWLITEGSKRQMPTGLVLDIAHLWHSGRLIASNHWRGEDIRTYSADPYASGKMDFFEYLQTLVSDIGPSLRLIHITGAKGDDTHLLPSALNITGDGEDSLDLKQSLISITQALPKTTHHLRVINEAHNSSYEAMAQSSQFVSELL